MIGLGGAEFRLPLLIGLFGFAALSEVILNQAMSLVVVLTALPARLAAVPFGEFDDHWAIAVNLLAGSLLGAWAGASWAIRMRTATLCKVLAVLMAGMAGALLLTHATPWGTSTSRPSHKCRRVWWQDSASKSSPRSWGAPEASC